MNDQPEINAPQQLHLECLALLNRYQHESDMTLCEVLGVLRIVEEDVLNKVRMMNRGT
jgi:hypothetical protein